MKIIIQFDDDTQRQQLGSLIPAGIETAGVQVTDLFLVRRILIFLRALNRTARARKTQ